MVTRRFPENDNPSAPPVADSSQLPKKDQTASSTESLADRRDGSSRAHMPRTLAQVLGEANEMVVRGDLSEYVPLPTDFDPLDGVIGGGLRKTELVLLGGAQGIGKTICALQMARNIAMRKDQFAFFVSYEHTEAHLLHRLLCLESVNPPEMQRASGVRLKDLHDIIVSERARSTISGAKPPISLQKILRENAKTSLALARLNQYADRLIMVKASPAVTTLQAIHEMTRRIRDATNGNVTVFIDYLQKVAIHPEKASDEAEKVTIVVEGLKDMALSLGVPVMSIVAADREGLKAPRLHLHHLRGSSALDYECDIAMIMNNKYHILPKDVASFNPYEAKQAREWVVFTIEKNRAGRAMQDIQFRLYAPYFSFDPHGQIVQQKLIDDKLYER